MLLSLKKKHNSPFEHGSSPWHDILSKEDPSQKLPSAVGSGLLHALSLCCWAGMAALADWQAGQADHSDQSDHSPGTAKDNKTISSQRLMSRWKYEFSYYYWWQASWSQLAYNRIIPSGELQVPLQSNWRLKTTWLLRGLGYLGLGIATRIKKLASKKSNSFFLICYFSVISHLHTFRRTICSHTEPSMRRISQWKHISVHKNSSGCKHCHTLRKWMSMIMWHKGQAASKNVKLYFIQRTWLICLVRHSPQTLHLFMQFALFTGFLQPLLAAILLHLRPNKLVHSEKIKIVLFEK